MEVNSSAKVPIERSGERIMGRQRKKQQAKKRNPVKERARVPQTSVADSDLPRMPDGTTEAPGSCSTLPRRYLKLGNVIFGMVVGIVTLCVGLPEIQRQLLHKKQIDVGIAWYENDGEHLKLIRPQDVVVNLSADDLARGPEYVFQLTWPLASGMPFR